MAALALALGLFALDARGVWESDEGRYTAVPVEMLRSGDLLTPRLNLDAPHLTKPPLTYWAVAASLAAFGHHELAARLPNLLAFLLTVLAVHAIARRLGAPKPWLPALIYATMPVTVLGASVVTTDTLLTLFETLAVLCFIVRRPGAMWLMFGLGFLTKGPPALLPLLAMLAWTGLREGRGALAGLFPLRGLLAFAVVGLGWFAWLIAREPALAGHFIGDELIGRIASDRFDRNPEWYAPFTVYLPVLIAGLLPWGLAVLPALPRLRDWATPARFRARLTDSPAAALLALWFLLPLVVFCLSRSRQPGYLLPLFAPLALLLGLALAHRLDPERWRWRALIALAVALPLALKLWLAEWPYYKDSRGLARHAVAEFAPTAADHIVFFGRWPQWGLRLYQPARVAWREVDQPLCDALAPADGRTLVIVLNKRPPDLAGALAGCGRAAPRRLAPFRDMGLFAIEPR